MGCGHTVHMCAHTQTTHMLARAGPAAEFAVGRPFLLSQPVPSLSSGEDGPGWRGGGGVLSQPYTLASEEGLRDQRIQSPLPIIQMGTLRPKEEEAQLESRKDHPGQGALHISNTHWAFWLPGLSPHPCLSLPPRTQPLISSSHPQSCGISNTGHQRSLALGTVEVKGTDQPLTVGGWSMEA